MLCCVFCCESGERPGCFRAEDGPGRAPHGTQPGQAWGDTAKAGVWQRQAKMLPFHRKNLRCLLLQRFDGACFGAEQPVSQNYRLLPNQPKHVLASLASGFAWSLSTGSNVFPSYSHALRYRLFDLKGLTTKPPKSETFSRGPIATQDVSTIHFPSKNDILFGLKCARKFHPLFGLFPDLPRGEHGSRFECYNWCVYG